MEVTIMMKHLIDILVVAIVSGGMIAMINGVKRLCGKYV